MPEVTFKGWQAEMMKVSFTKMLQHSMNLNLSEAKRITDDVLEGKEITLKTETIEKANRIAIEATFAGVICVMSKNE